MKRPFLRLRLAPVLTFATATFALSGRADDVAVFRIADEGSVRVSAARATRGAGSGVTVVVVLETPRGGHLPSADVGPITLANQRWHSA